jgi:hypothetical protein
MVEREGLRMAVVEHLLQLLDERVVVAVEAGEVAFDGGGRDWSDPVGSVWCL